jgi:hypothetical protein
VGADVAGALEGLLFVRQLLLDGGPGLLHEVHASIFEGFTHSEACELRFTCGLLLAGPYHLSETLFVRLLPEVSLGIA